VGASGNASLPLEPVVEEEEVVLMNPRFFKLKGNCSNIPPFGTPLPRASIYIIVVKGAQCH